MDVPREIEVVDDRLIAVARYASPFAAAASPAFAEALLRAVAGIGMSAERPAEGMTVHVHTRMTLIEGASAERVHCRIEGASDRCVVSVEARLAIVLMLGATPRIAGVMVGAPWRLDTLQPLSTTCRLDRGGRVTYEWWFARGGRIYVVDVQPEEGNWKATLQRQLRPIDVGVLDPCLATDVGTTPAEAFYRIVAPDATDASLPKSRAAYPSDRPWHGLGND